MTFRTIRGLVAVSALAAATLAGCSSGTGTPTSLTTGKAPASTAGGGGTNDGPVVSGDTAWGDGKHITSPIVIAAGATVTIAAGATITCDDGITITVQGSLKSAGGAPSKITGAAWNGIVVAAGGTLALDGVDIENAHTAIEVQTKANPARYDRGTITASVIPLLVDSAATLTTAHANVVASQGTSHVLGSLTASYLDYDANGFDGMTTESDDALLTIDDSHMHGTNGTSDMIVSYTGAAKIHVAYSIIEQVHCAFHLERVTSLDVAYVTARQDSYGFMMHGSLSTGTRTIQSSNFMNNYEWGIHEEDASINGPIAVSGCYFNSNQTGDLHLHAASAIQVSGTVAAPVAGAAPR